MTGPNPAFKGTPLFDARNISETVQDRHTDDRIQTYTRHVQIVISHALE